MTDFNEIHNRYQTLSVKWDNTNNVFQSDEVLPMWVADMDFKAPDAVNKALKERAEHGIYGYTIINEDIKANVTNWLKKRHHFNVETEELVFSPGVITSLHTAIENLTDKNDKIVLQTPVYTPFFNLIKDNEREVVENELLFDGSSYQMDFVDLEEKFKQGAKAFMLCSPHNPVGRVWTKEELKQLADLCMKYDVLIFSDEIHADLTFNNHQHIPIASLSEEISNRTITFMSPTKTFNLAGLQASFMVIADQKKRNMIAKQMGTQGFNMLNTMGVIALNAAYESGLPWLEELLSVIERNKDYAKSRLEKETDNRLTVINSEGTYLLWIDCSQLNLTDNELQNFMVNQAKVGLNRGSSYGTPGEQFMRLNLACPKHTLEEGINRIVEAIHQL